MASEAPWLSRPIAPETEAARGLTHVGGQRMMVLPHYN
jgi:hypothetical protein